MFGVKQMEGLVKTPIPVPLQETPYTVAGGGTNRASPVEQVVFAVLMEGRGGEGGYQAPACGLPLFHFFIARSPLPRGWLVVPVGTVL